MCFLKRVNYANALIFDDYLQQVLLVRNGTENSSYWSFPGGEIEGSETLEQAIIREVKEETGLKVMTDGLYSVREVFFKQRGEHALIFTFIANIIKGELRISDPDNEILEARWMDIKTANMLMPYIPEHIVIPLGDKMEKSAYYFFHGQV